MGTSQNVVLEVKNLSKTYPGARGALALKGIDFSVRRGEIFGILGINGAGKSTTLNILMGLVSPSGGKIKILGKNFFGHESELKERMNIATAYADLATSLTVYENLSVYAKLYGVPSAQIKITSLLKEFGAYPFKDKRFGELSAGQKTRANLCKGFINDPEILLLDEPTASLDPSIAADVRRIIRHYQKTRQLTILLTSHNMKEVEEMCNRVALIQAGEIYRIDSPQALIEYLKVPSMEEVFLKLARSEMEDPEAV
jgi:ABC-2 type transport system ATP-binding protein